MSIVGLPASEETTILNKLENSQFEFYLTGSRAGLNQVTSKSDWDFFTHNATNVEQFLRDIGFKRSSTSYKDDPQIATVYRYTTDTSHIDVQCVAEFEKKVRIQNALKKSQALYGLTKAQARGVWRAMYELLAGF